MTEREHTVEFSVHCGHPSNQTVTVINDGVCCVICESCYQEKLPEFRKIRLEMNPLQDGVACLLCGSDGPCRMNKDLGIPICDTCYAQSQQVEETTRVPVHARQPVLPDKISDYLYIGPKQSAYH